jgi:hypothetical protein
VTLASFFRGLSNFEKDQFYLSIDRLRLVIDCGAIYGVGEAGPTWYDVYTIEPIVPSPGADDR